jgi:DNA invertase Pin-like site-specific DNA recombinase
MSTEHQKYSIDNQKQVIAEYALCHDIKVVRTYIDAGRSGLNLKGRDALQQLIADI